jgi:streptogramin lyase
MPPLKSYAADMNVGCILKVDKDGNVTTAAGIGISGGSGDGKLATEAELSDPGGIAVDSDENIYIADTGNNRIRKIDHVTGNITTIAGTDKQGYSGDEMLATESQLNYPVGLTLVS